MELRAKAILKVLLGGGVFSILTFWFSHPEAYPFGYMPVGPGSAMLMGIPCLIAVTGLVEIITKRPFSETEDAWSNIRGLKKFLLRIAMYIAVGAFVLAIITLFFHQ